MGTTLALTVVRAAAEAEAASGPSPYLIGAIALALLLTLLAIVLAFRNVGTRNRYRDAGDRHGAHAAQDELARYGSDYAHQNPEQYSR